MSVVASYKDLGILIFNELILTEEERGHMVSLVRGISKKRHKATQSQDRHKNIGLTTQPEFLKTKQLGRDKQGVSMAIYSLIGVNTDQHLDLVWRKETQSILP